MSIYGYELHIKTDKSIGGMVDYLKSKGFSVDLQLCKDKDSIKLEIRHPQQNKSYEYKVKLYDEEGDTKHYEIMSYGKEKFAFSEELFKDL